MPIMACPVKAVSLLPPVHMRVVFVCIILRSHPLLSYVRKMVLSSCLWYKADVPGML
jgi:hypothetical protein